MPGAGSLADPGRARPAADGNRRLERWHEPGRREGRGESVWLGFFLYAILGDFIPVCGQHGDHDRARRYAAFRRHLAEALNEHGWDGDWYRRAWYDDGAALGSAASDECQIDALAQAWAVISKAAPWARAEAALDAVERHLISEEDGLIRLLTPPFENTPHDPGYIKGYVAGVRENGGQYTHAALWVVRALAELGRRDRAVKLLDMLTPISHAMDPGSGGGLSARTVRGRRRCLRRGAACRARRLERVHRRGGLDAAGGAGIHSRSGIGSRGTRCGCALHSRPLAGFPSALPPAGRRAIYDIEVRNPDGRAERVVAVEIDEPPGGVEQGAACIPLFRDGQAHQVIVTLARDEEMDDVAESGSACLERVRGSRTRRSNAKTSTAATQALIAAAR